MRGIGLMASMMGMGWRLGRGEAGTAVSIGRVSGMGLECIDFILVMFMLGNGRMGKVMAVEPILVKTVVDMWGNSSGVLSTAMATIILEMGTHMLENTLQTRCMGLEFISLPTVIGMREPGMRVEGKGLECTPLEMERLNLGTGKMGFLTSQALKAQPILYLLLLFIIPKYSMLFRKHAEQQRRPMM